MATDPVVLREDDLDESGREAFRRYAATFPGRAPGSVAFARTAPGAAYEHAPALSDSPRAVSAETLAAARTLIAALPPLPADVHGHHVLVTVAPRRSLLGRARPPLQQVIVSPD